MSESLSTGIILGRFLPPHRGHEYLVHFASAFVDKLWIFVCSLPSDPIPGALRVQWMTELFPHATIIHIFEINPAANRQQPGAPAIWAQAVKRHLPGKADYVFASEHYGWDFARALSARFIPVDPSRDQFPISGTELRSRPFRHWHYLPAVVRPHFAQELMIDIPGMGPEGAEETIRKAAMLLNTLYVPVYSRFYRHFDQAAEHALDPETATKAQTALVASLKTQARCFLLRSSLEGGGAGLKSGTANAIIRLAFDQCVDDGSEIRSSPAGEGEAETVTICCKPETAAHAIRDYALDRYKAWF